MLALRNLARAAPQARAMVREMSIVSGPPTVHVSAVEKAIHGLFITGSMMIIPAWVLVNIKNYKHRD